MTLLPARPTLLFFTRDGCHLCDDARETLQAVLEERAAAGQPNPVVREVDITTDAAAETRYRGTIPVLALEGSELPLATSGSAIRAFVDRMLDRQIA